MKKYVIILLFVLFIDYGCSSAFQKEIQQQFIELSDSTISVTNDYIKLYLEIIEKNHFSIISKTNLSEKDTTILTVAMIKKEEKVDSLYNVGRNLSGMLETPLLKLYAWNSFRFSNASVMNMQVEFYARLMNARKKLNEDAFYSLYVESYSKYKESFNKEIKERHKWIKILGLKSDIGTENKPAINY